MSAQVINDEVGSRGAQFGLRKCCAQGDNPRQGCSTGQHPGRNIFANHAVGGGKPSFAAASRNGWDQACRESRRSR